MTLRSNPGSGTRAQRSTLASSLLLGASGVLLVACGFAAVSLAARSGARADAATVPAANGDESMVVPGGTASLLWAAHMPEGVEPARAWLILARAFHGGQPEEGPPLRAAAIGPYAAEAARAAESQADRVPALLPRAVWEEAVFAHPVAPADLAFSILQNRRASLLYVGLFSLDPETLAYFASHPALVASIGDAQVGPFAAFAESLSIRDGRVVLPGGDAFAPDWERLVGAPAGEPERFIPALLGHGGGRLAWMLDTLAALDPPRRQFALQAGVARAYEGFSLDRRSVDFARHPFKRPPIDLDIVLRTIGVDGDGRLSAPRDVGLWERVFNGRRGSASGGEVASAWLLRAFAPAGDRERRARLETMLFAQRVFGPRLTGPVSGPVLDELARPIQAFRDHETLMLALEHLGFTEPRDFADAVRTADALSVGIDGYRASLRVAMFQGGLAIVVRLVDAGTIDRAAAQRLVRGLAGLPVAPSGGYSASISRWLEEHVLPSLPPAGGASDAEQRLLDALAGIRDGKSLPVIQWEGYTYRVDVAAGERARLRRIRERQGGNDLTTLLMLRQLSRAGGRALVPTLRATMTRLGLLDDRPVFALGQPPPPPPGAKDARGGAEPAIQPDRWMDILAAELMASYAYAIAIGDTDAPMLLAGNPARQHDFDLGDHGSWRSAIGVRAGSQLIMQGSLVGLDRALAVPSLRQATLDAPASAPNLGEADLQGIAESAIAMNPFRLEDRARDELAAAIRRGRDRITGAARSADALDALAEGAGVERWRRRLMRLAVPGGVTAVMSYWSLGEVCSLGQPAPPVDLRVFGAAQRSVDGSWQAALPGRFPVHELGGRFGAGVVTTAFADMNLRVVEWLADLGLPAVLAPGVLRAAAWDLAMSTRMADPDDWLAPIRAVQALRADRLGDHVSALTADGPLVPVSQAAGPGDPSRRGGRTLRIGYPPGGAYVSGEVLAQASIEPADQPVDHVAFFIDGRLTCTSERSPFECAWNAGEEVRSHLFRVAAYLPGGDRLVQIARTRGVEYAEPGGIDMVHVTATVLDANGRFVRGLSKADFGVFEDGVEQKIDYFAPESSPLELVLGIDVSGSLSASIDKVKENVKSFVASLRPGGRVTIVLFNQNFFVLTPPSMDDPADRLKAIDRLSAWGATSLHEALVRSFDLLGRRPTRRALVVFTDGDDTASRIPRETVERRSETSDAVVYLIGQGRAVESAGLKELCRRLTSISGGRAFFPRRIEELKGALDEIVKETENQYLLSYAAPSSRRESSFHRIRVSVKGGYEVRARQGYRRGAR